MRPFILSWLVLLLVFGVGRQSHGKVIPLFDDEEGFKDNLSSGLPTNIENEKKDVFRGKLSVRVSEDVAGKTDRQRYNNRIANWQFSIVEKPANDTEARWIVFAWKSIGGRGIMTQLPDNGNWGAVTTPFVKPPAPGTRRYIAGENLTGWTGIQVSASPPAKWEVVRRDLFGDFGQFLLTGIALTPFNNVGLWDAIYLGWTGDELKNIASLPVESRGKLASRWAELKSP